MDIETVDFLIIGSGVAGLRAAIELAPHGNVLVATKDMPSESSTEYAQGGIAVALSEDDIKEVEDWFFRRYPRLAKVIEEKMKGKNDIMNQQKQTKGGD